MKSNASEVNFFSDEILISFFSSPIVLRLIGEHKTIGKIDPNLHSILIWSKININIWFSFCLSVCELKGKCELHLEDSAKTYISKHLGCDELIGVVLGKARPLMASHFVSVIIVVFDTHIISSFHRWIMILIDYTFDCMCEAISRWKKRTHLFDINNIQIILGIKPN